MGFFGWLKGDKQGSSSNQTAAGTQVGEVSRSSSTPTPISANTPASPPQRIIDDFTPLTDAYVNAQGSSESAVAYFTKFFSLPSVSAIPAIPPGEKVADLLARGQPIGPLCVRQDGQLLMVLFTSGDRAFAAAKQNGLAVDDDVFGTLSFSMPAALSMMLQSQVDGFIINMNRGDHGITMPLPGMASMFEYITDSLPPEGLMPFLINETNRPSAWGQHRVARRIIKDVRTLHFAGDVSRPGSPLPFVGQNGEAFLCLFTDQDAVLAGANMVVPGAQPGQVGTKVSLIPTNPADALAYADKLKAHSEGAVKEFVINIGPASTIVHFDAWRKALSELNPVPGAS